VRASPILGAGTSGIVGLSGESLSGRMPSSIKLRNSLTEKASRRRIGGRRS
jgi:hypothetical protein